MSIHSFFKCWLIHSLSSCCLAKWAYFHHCRSEPIKTCVYCSVVWTGSECWLNLIPLQTKVWVGFWLTLQPLQQSPLLHMASWVSVHFLQQAPPLRAHSCSHSGESKWTCVFQTTSHPPVLIQRHNAEVKLDFTHNLGSTVTLLPWLHKAIPTIWRIQQLRDTEGNRYEHELWDSKVWHHTENLLIWM